MDCKECGAEITSIKASQRQTVTYDLIVDTNNNLEYDADDYIDPDEMEFYSGDCGHTIENITEDEIIKFLKDLAEREDS